MFPVRESKLGADQTKAVLKYNIDDYSDTTITQ